MKLKYKCKSIIHNAGICLMVVNFSLITFACNSPAAKNATPLSPSSVTTVQPILGIPKRIEDIQKQARNSRLLTDADLAYLLSQTQSQSPQVVSGALTPLLQINVKSLRSEQQQQIFDVINDLLARDDLAYDPSGEIKMACNAVVMLSFSDKRFLISLQKQTNDSRKLVRSSTEEAIAAVRYAK